MSIQLKIKFKSLSEEARIIRQEELKIKLRAAKMQRAKANLTDLENDPEKLAKWEEIARTRTQSLTQMRELSCHRKNKVRQAARSTHLTRGFLAGTPYRAIENEKTRTIPDWNHIWNMAKRYADPSIDIRDLNQKFAEFKHENS